MRRGGAGVVRAAILWAAVQRSPGGDYDWQRYDELVARLAVSQVRLLPVLIGSPPFIAEEQGEPPTTRVGKRRFNTFVRAAVNRYGRGGRFWQTRHGRLIPYTPVTAWEVWNEPNIARFWTACAPDAREYVALLRGAEAAIRAADPRADVVLAGMPELGQSRGRMRMSDFLEDIYEVRGARGLFDVVAMHPYAPSVGGVDERIARIRAVMRRHGDASKPLWITEMGWSSAGPRSHVLVKDETRQARLLEQTFALLERRRARYRLETVVWFQWRDPVRRHQASSSGSWESGSGLFLAGGKPKPAWRAFTRSARGTASLEPIPPGILFEDFPSLEHEQPAAGGCD